MIAGVIIHSKGIGKSLGYPTANLDCVKKEVKLPQGVYAAWAALDNKKYKSGLVIIDDPWSIEVHLIDYAGGDIYGKMISIEAVQKVSEIERHETTEELVKKIEHDIGLVKQVLT
jgi:riboflavin kinase/FMN adenylyltransferase